MNTSKLTDYWIETWNERAAILEYEAGMTRHEAEQAAWDEVSVMILKGDRSLLSKIAKTIQMAS